MLKKRLAESKQSIQLSYAYADNSMMFGNDVSEECENHREIMKRDIDELKFLIWCVKNRDAIKEIFVEYGA
jgi:hypothetical protein